MCNVINYRTVQQNHLGPSNVLSQFAQQYVDADTCGKFGNHIIPVITSFLFVPTWQCGRADMLTEMMYIKVLVDDTSLYLDCDSGDMGSLL